MARKLKIMENEKHKLDDLKNDEITKKREKCEMHTEGPGIWRVTDQRLFPMTPAVHSLDILLYPGELLASPVTART